MSEQKAISGRMPLLYSLINVFFTLKSENNTKNLIR